MAWNVSSCNSGDTGSAARSIMSSCERVFSGPWARREKSEDTNCDPPKPPWHLPSIRLTSPRLGVSALKAFSLARTAWASWAVSSGPLEVMQSNTGTSGCGDWEDWAQTGDIKGRGEGQVKDWTQELGRWLGQENSCQEDEGQVPPPRARKSVLEFPVLGRWTQGILGPGWKTWARKEPFKKTAKWLMARTALPKDMSSAPSTHIQRLTATCHASSRGSDPSSGQHENPHVHTHTIFFFNLSKIKGGW